MEKFIGGLRLADSFWGNCANVTFPFATLEINEEKCIITRTIWWISKTTYILEYKNIEYVTTKSFLFQWGIQFVHNDKSIPKYLLFWTFRKNEICNLFKKLGLEIRYP